MDIPWESELARLLSRLGVAQQQMLDLLNRKRELLIQRDHQALAQLAPEERRLSLELQACLVNRQELLAHATSAGQPGDSVRSLVDSLPPEQAQPLLQPIDEAQRRAHLLRHHCLAQWVAMQRTMLHLSHLIEILATGGQIKPTYGRGGTTAASGALMDQAV